MDEDSFDQDLYIDIIDNPFTVNFDPNSKLPDGSDAEKALVTDLMRKDVFRKTHPGAQESGFTHGLNSDPDWITEQDIRLAEYFFVQRTKSKLLMLSDATPASAYELSRIKQLLAAAGIGLVAEPDSFQRIAQCR